MNEAASARACACLVAGAALLVACGAKTTDPAEPVALPNPSTSPQQPAPAPPPATPPPPVPPAPPADSPTTYRLTLDLRTADGGPFDGYGFSGVVFSHAQAGDECYASCSRDFPAGTKVTMTFTPYSTMVVIPLERVSTWTGPCAGTGNVCTVMLDRDVSVSAQIEPHPHTIVFVERPVGTGNGSVRANRQANSYLRYSSDETIDPYVLELGERLTLDPVAEAGSHFGGWSGACDGAGLGQCTIVASKNEELVVTAAFDLDVHARYRLATILPLHDARQMRGGFVAGTVGMNSAVFDVKTGNLMAPGVRAGWSTGIAVNRRGDLAGVADGHPFVAYASGASVVLDTLGGEQLFGQMLALDDLGVATGNDGVSGPPDHLATFTFDGTAVRKIDAPTFKGYAANASGTIAGCGDDGRGAFVRGASLDVTTSHCFIAVNAAGVALANKPDPPDGSVGLLWDGIEHELPGLWKATALDDTGTVAGAIDAGGHYTGRLSIYHPRLHAAVLEGAQPLDLNALVDTSRNPEVAHVEMDQVLSLDDGGWILVSFANRKFGVLAPL